MIVSIINKSKNELPKYQTLISAGMDLRANIDEPIIIKPLQSLVVNTGLFISLEPGYEAQIRQRSGLALNKGITVINSPGTIDADYRGEIGVILINLSDSSFEINSGDRIAHMIIAKHETIWWRVVEKLDKSDRGNKGFGSTGV